MFKSYSKQVPLSTCKTAHVSFDNIQYMSKVRTSTSTSESQHASPDSTPLKPDTIKHLLPASSSRVNSSELASVTLLRETLAKAVGFQQTEFLVKHIHKLSNNKVHIQRLQKSPFIDPGESATMKLNQRNKTPSIPPQNYSDIWHIDIGYGPCTSIGGISITLTLTLTLHHIKQMT